MRAKKKVKSGSARRNASKPKLALVKKQNGVRSYAKSQRRPAARGGFFKNPFAGGKVAGLGVTDVVGAAGGVLLNEALGLVLPAGWMGIGIQFGVAVGLTKVAPKSFAAGAGIGAGAVALKNAVNKLTGNAITNFVNSSAQRLIPAPAPMPQTGVTGFADYPRAVRVG